MPTCRFINTQELKKLQQKEAAVIIDIRMEDEYHQEHIEGAINIPLANLNKAHIQTFPAEKIIVFHCQTGVRTLESQETLKNLGVKICILKGGLNAWKKLNFKIIKNKNAKLPIMRQVQIVVGFMVLLGVILSYWFSPYFNLLSAFFGAGLLFAGLSGTCGLAHVLARLPFNK